jgi:uncharacterized protein YndB with AHSA1/START domain
MACGDRIAPPMGPVVATISIDAPRERVFEVLSDLAYRPTFCDHFADEYHLQRLESRGIGAAARFYADARGFPMWMETVITELEAPHRIIERGHGSRSDRMAVGTAWELVEGPGATTELTVTFWAEPEMRSDKAKAHLGASRWYRKQWLKALKRLRDMLESGEPIESMHVGGASRI